MAWQSSDTDLVFSTVSVVGLMLICGNPVGIAFSETKNLTKTLTIY